MSKKIQKWSIEDVSSWLENVGLGKYSEMFCFNEIDGKILATLTENDVRLPPLSMPKFSDIRKFGFELKKALAKGGNGVKKVPLVKNSPVVVVTNVKASAIRKSATPTKAEEEETASATFNLESMEEEINCLDFEDEHVSKTQERSPSKNWEDFFCDDNEIEYLKYFPRQTKPTKGLHRVFFSSVISANEISVYNEEQKKFLVQLSDKMQSLHSEDGFSLPEEYMEIGYACAVLDDDDLWYRGRIVSDPSDDSVEVLLVDYNKTITVQVPCLKALRADSILKEEVQIFRCQVTNINVETGAELKLFREMLLDENNNFYAYFKRNSTEPYPITIHIAAGSVVLRFNEIYIEKLLQKQFSQLDIGAVDTRRKSMGKKEKSKK